MNAIRMTQNLIFKNLIEGDKMSGDSLMGYLEGEDFMKTIIAQVHHYAITKTTDGRFATFIDDATKPHGRRQVRRKSQSDLYAYLLEHYGVHEVKADLTYEKLFQEWIGYKKNFVGDGVRNSTVALSPSTICRYERDYAKYLAASELAQLTIGSITSTKLQSILADVIGSHNMSDKCAKNLLSIITQSFAYAYRSEYLDRDVSALLDIRLLRSLCARRERSDDLDRVFTISELKSLKTAVRAHMARHPFYTADYAILVSALTGMRVGELAALRWSDVELDSSESFICVSSSEHRDDVYGEGSTLRIGDTKTHKVRRIPVTPELRSVLQELQELTGSASEFLFVRQDGTRFTAHDISCAVARRAKEAGIEKRASNHQIRRTVSSMLNATTLSQKDVATILGHSQTVNERHYNYSTAEYDEKIKALTQLSQSQQ